jgi:Lrp/AsnC family leucine-responsive transcriptional regulator
MQNEGLDDGGKIHDCSEFSVIIENTEIPRLSNQIETVESTTKRMYFAGMDDIDRKIIAHLQQNARDSYAGIAMAVGLSVSAVNERLKKLEANGTITGWSITANAEKLGRPTLAFVSVALEGTKHDAAFVAAMAALPDVLECHHVTGAWSYLLKIRVASNAALERAIVDRIKRAAGVSRTETVIALSSAKDTHVVACGP